MPLVSVIIPCFNQASYIERAVGSVISQSFTDWEIIIVNDGSTEKFTNDFLATYSPPKTTILNTVNKGVSAARNLAINQAHGKFILPLDADDYISSTYLKEAVEIFETKKSIKLVYSEGQYFGDINGSIDLPQYDLKTILQQNLIFNSAFYKKEDWTKCEGYDESFLTGWEDWEFYLRLITSETEVFKLKAVHYFYRIKNVSRNALLKDENLAIVEQQLYKKHLSKYLLAHPLPITLGREFSLFTQEKENFNKMKVQIYNTLSYRIGHFLLTPFRLLRRNSK